MNINDAMTFVNLRLATESSASSSSTLAETLQFLLLITFFFMPRVKQNNYFIIISFSLDTGLVSFQDSAFYTFSQLKLVTSVYVKSQILIHWWNSLAIISC